MNELFDLEKRPLSFSSLKQFDKSAQHYVAYRNKEFKPSKDMIIGSAFHCFLLEDEGKFEHDYYVLDDTEIISEIGGAKPTMTKAYKEWKAIEMEKAGNRVVMSMADLDLIIKMQQAVLKHPEAKELLDSCTEFEKKVSWTGKTGLPMTSYLDGFGPNVFMDLKTTQDANPWAFQRSIFKFQYHVQAAMYAEALDENFNPVDAVKIIAIDKTDMNSVSVHNFNKDVLDAGTETYYKWVQKFEDFRDDPEKFSVSYPGEIQVRLPKWMETEDLLNPAL